MKVYVSIPLDGKTEEQVKAEVTELIPTFGFAVGDFLTGYSEEAEPMKRFLHAISVMETCDAFWCMKGYKKDKIRKLEREIAEAFDIPVYE